jgi:hypothetical protein
VTSAQIIEFETDFLICNSGIVSNVATPHEDGIGKLPGEAESSNNKYNL